MGIENDTRFGLGQSAFEQGAPVADCPYPRGSDARSFWLLGWDKAWRYANREKEQGSTKHNP